MDREPLDQGGDAVTRHPDPDIFAARMADLRDLNHNDLANGLDLANERGTLLAELDLCRRGQRRDNRPAAVDDILVDLLDDLEESAAQKDATSDIEQARPPTVLQNHVLMPTKTAVHPITDHGHDLHQHEGGLFTCECGFMVGRRDPEQLLPEENGGRRPKCSAVLKRETSWKLIPLRDIEMPLPWEIR